MPECAAPRIRFGAHVAPAVSAWIAAVPIHHSASSTTADASELRRFVDGEGSASAWPLPPRQSIELLLLAPHWRPAPAASSDGRARNQESRHDSSSARAHPLQEVLAGQQELQAIRFLGQAAYRDLELAPREAKPREYRLSDHVASDVDAESDQRRAAVPLPEAE